MAHSSNNSPRQVNPSAVLIIGIEGTHLTQRDVARIQSPLVAGIILFTRNFESKAQVKRLCDDIRGINPRLFICVDQEGGRVMRFRDGFSDLPPLYSLNKSYAKSPAQALIQAEALGFIMAREIRQAGVDFSFAPVLDAYDIDNPVIGDRAFSDDPAIITRLAGAYLNGLEAAGVASCGKHFPGHGKTLVDSHFEIPVDDRAFAQLEDEIKPFLALSHRLTALMPAHIIFASVSAEPVGYSKFWHRYIRETAGFQGAVISDDLGMAGATTIKCPVERVTHSLASGCDAVLLCNEFDVIDETIEMISESVDTERQQRLSALFAKGTRVASGVDHALLAAKQHLRESLLERL